MNAAARGSMSETGVLAILYVRAHLYLSLHMFVYIYIQHTNLHLYVNVCMCVCMCMCMCVYVIGKHTCMCLCICACSNMYMYTYMVLVCTRLDESSLKTSGHPRFLMELRLERRCQIKGSKGGAQVSDPHFTQRLGCSSFLGSIMESLNMKHVITKQELH